MPNVIDNAVARVQAIGAAMEAVSIKSAADYPTEAANPFPMMVTFVSSGTATLGNATTLYVYPSLRVEFHFSPVDLKQTQKDINAVIIEFMQRVAGDPTLAGLISTVQAGEDSPVIFNQSPAEYNKLKSQMLVFTLPFKIMLTPTSTP